MISSSKENNREFKMSMRDVMCKLNAISKLQNFWRMFLFQKLDQQNEKIRNQICNKNQNEILRRFMYQLEYLQYYLQKSSIQHENKYLNEKNIFPVFLLSIQIEIDVHRRYINFILPNIFKIYLRETEYKTPTQDFHKQLFKKLCEDFEIDDKQGQDITIFDFYELLLLIMANPVSKKNQDKLIEFQDAYNLNEEQLNLKIEEPQQEPQQVPKKEESFQEQNILENQPIGEQDLIIDQSQASIINDVSNSNLYAKSGSLRTQSTLNESIIYSAENNQIISTISQNIFDSSKNVNPIISEQEIIKPQSILISKIKYMIPLIIYNNIQNQEIIISKCSNRMIHLVKDNQIDYNWNYVADKKCILCIEQEYKIKSAKIKLYKQLIQQQNQDIIISKFRNSMIRLGRDIQRSINWNTIAYKNYKIKSAKIKFNKQLVKQQNQDIWNSIEYKKCILCHKIKFNKSLIKQQNQEIIMSRCSNSMIPLGQDNIIFYNQKYDVKLQKQYNKRILYIGQLDYNYEQQGKGLFKQIDLKVEYEGQFDQGLQSGFGKQTNLNYRYEGTFYQGQKQGFLKITDLKSNQLFYSYFQYDIQQQQFQDEQSFILQKQRQTHNQHLIEREIIENKQCILSNQTLKTLNIGMWLQEKIIDYYLVELRNFYKQLHKNQVNYRLYTTSNSQDIFSSNLDYKNFDFKELEQLININQLRQLVSSQSVINENNNNQITRTIFAMNLNRSHFITIVIENSRIYILNSLSSDLVQLCEIIKRAYEKIGINLHYDRQDYEIQIHQQQEFYSCGVQTCYVINQLIKCHNTQVKDIQFNNTRTEIQKYTTHMKNVILTRKSIHIKRQVL